jgi:hypothetical protein
MTDVGVDTVRYTDEDPSFTGGSTWYYRVYVRDQLGASVGSNEVSATIDNWPTDQKLIIPGEFPAYMAKLDNGSGRYVLVSHMTTPGQITVINHVTDGIFKTLDVPGRAVGIASNQYIETLVAGFDDDTIYRVHGFDLDFTEDSVAVGEGPWDVASAWGPGDSLYAFTGTGDNQNSSDDSISVINLWTGVLDHTFHSGGVHYSHFGASPDGWTVYAASPWGTVATIDPVQWRISQVFGGYQNIFDLNVTENRIYLPHQEAGQVSILNRYSMQLERTLTAPGGPVYCLELPGQQYLYVCCQTEGLIRIYSMQTWQQIDSINIAVPTCMVSNDAGDKIYVTRLGSGGGVIVFGY